MLGAGMLAARDRQRVVARAVVGEHALPACLRLAREAAQRYLARGRPRDPLGDPEIYLPAGLGPPRSASPENIGWPKGGVTSQRNVATRSTWPPSARSSGPW